MTVPEDLFHRESVPLSMHGCMKSMKIKQHTFCVRPCTPSHFYYVSTHIGSFEEAKATVGGHRGRAVQTVDLGATLTDSSDYKLSQILGVSVRPLTALSPDSLGKTVHRHFPQKFYKSKTFGLSPFKMKCTPPLDLQCHSLPHAFLCSLVTR